MQYQKRLLTLICPPKWSIIVFSELIQWLRNWNAVFLLQHHGTICGSGFLYLFQVSLRSIVFQSWYLPGTQKAWTLITDKGTFDTIHSSVALAIASIVFGFHCLTPNASWLFDIWDKYLCNTSCCWVTSSRVGYALFTNVLKVLSKLWARFQSYLSVASGIQPNTNPCMFLVRISSARSLVPSCMNHEQ